MSSIILEFDRNPQISEIDRLQSFMESVQRAFNEIEVSHDDLELEKHPLIGTISKDNQDFKVLFKDYAQFKVVTANAVEAIKGTFETLDAEYAKIDMANIGTAWVGDLLVHGNFLADSVDAATGQFTKWLAGVRIHGDLIEANTLKAKVLIIEGEDGIFRRLNISALGEAVVDSDPKYNEGLDGSIIVAESITADKINATEFFGQDITTTGNFKIGAGGVLVYDKTKDELHIRAKSIQLGSKDLSQSLLEITSLTTFMNSAKDGSQTIINGGAIKTETLTALGAVTAGSFNIGNGNFVVTTGGVLTAKGADIQGKITATDGSFVGVITAKDGGSIGGFTVKKDTYLALGTTGFKTTDNSIYIGTDGISLGKTFGVSKAGALTAKGADIQGKITADSGSFTGTITANDGGNIGGFTIKKGSYIAYNTSSLAGADNSVYVGINGISLGTKFKVDTNGKVTATEGVFSGEITANKLTITEGATISGLHFDKLVGSQDVKTSIGNAANTAKHFLEWDGTNGLQVGNKQNGSWVGTRARIAPTSYDILDESGNPVSKFGSKIIDLGIAASDARINLCGGAGYIKAEAEGSVWSKILLHAKTLSLQSTGNAVGGVKLLAKSTSDYVASFDLIAASSEAATFATLEVAGKTYTFGTGTNGFKVPVGISAPTIYLSDGAITGAGTRPTYNGSSLALKKDVSDIRCGSYGMGVEIAAGSYRDITHSFSPAFASEPNVVATLFSNGTAAALGNVEVAIVSKSTTAVKFRIFNNSGAARSPGLTWMAMC